MSGNAKAKSDESSPTRSGHANPLSYAAIRPWLFVPVLYVMQAIPATLVREVATLLYKDLGIPNARITLWVGLLALPWMLKMFWGPVVDLNFSRRRWVLAMQTAVIATLAGLSVVLRLPAFFPISLAILFLMAFASATHDIALDGLYLLALTKPQQAAFVGVQSACFRAGRWLCVGPLVFLAGALQKTGVSIVGSWTIVIVVLAALYGGGSMYARFFLPRLETDVPVGNREHFWPAFTTFVQQPRIAAVLAFILFFRLGEAMVTLVAPLFMRDARAVGGMGLTVADIGAINGVAGIPGIILGGIAGGAIISRHGLRRSFWPLVVCMHAPNLLYVWAAYTHPPTWTMYGVAFVDQFGYGFGFAGYSVYLMYVAQHGQYRTSHFAIATGLGSLCITLAGILSSILQSVVSYRGFFVAVCVCTIPGMLTLLIIPLEESRDGQ